MNYWQNPLLIMSLVPLVGTLIILCVPDERKNFIRMVAMITSLAVFGVAIWMLTLFQPELPGMQFSLDIPWFRISNFTIHFILGVDGISILLVFTDDISHPPGNPFHLESDTGKSQRVHGILPAARNRMLGVFLAQDLILFYIFGNSPSSQCIS
jgi:NADH-quinone oxidoreductase subunit M